MLVKLILLLVFVSAGNAALISWYSGENSLSVIDDITGNITSLGFPLLEEKYTPDPNNILTAMDYDNSTLYIIMMDNDHPYDFLLVGYSLTDKQIVTNIDLHGEIMLVYALAFYGDQSTLYLLANSHGNLALFCLRPSEKTLTRVGTLPSGNINLNHIIPASICGGTSTSNGGSDGGGGGIMFVLTMDPTTSGLMLAEFNTDDGSSFGGANIPLSTVVGVLAAVATYRGYIYYILNLDYSVDDDLGALFYLDLESGMSGNIESYWTSTFIYSIASAVNFNKQFFYSYVYLYGDNYPTLISMPISEKGTFSNKVALKNCNRKPYTYTISLPEMENCPWTLHWVDL